MSAPGRNEETDLPLVLLPGTLCDARVFGAITPQLRATGYSIEHFDMTGLGSAHALAMRALAQYPGRFIPVGFSLGAIVALELAAIAPERIAALGLIAANGRDVPPADHAARRAAASSDPAALVGDILWPRSVAVRARDDHALRATIMDMAASQPAGTLALQTEVALTRFDKRPLLARMTMPTLVLGGAEDRIAPPELQRELAEELPEAELVIVPDAGHFLPLERPEPCARALADWLVRIRAVA
ncbi:MULTISPECIES: alpha/beta hydrolase [unclassified Sphingomonas]|uniref:alpha/beta fold hydrolase n=1 Tax=unclassified Sphingomonas TaxID=196159 RepID=UPI000AEF599D|nr:MULTISPECIES: alpha/beta hydrolase [unclassified Sphingomonas]